jgi:hypothetical protein
MAVTAPDCARLTRRKENELARSSFVNAFFCKLVSVNLVV